MAEETANANEQLSNNPEPEVQKKHNYVVHGAKIICSMGTAQGRLTAFLSHGVYLRGKAQLNKYDCMANVNINCMGICLCSGSPQVNVKPEELTSDIETIFNTQRAQAAKNNGSNCQVCVPVINMPWQNTDKETVIQLMEALLKCSVIQCARGGTIIIVDDGQMES